jgi:hypothetical protein
LIEHTGSRILHRVEEVRKEQRLARDLVFANGLRLIAKICPENTSVYDLPEIDKQLGVFRCPHESGMAWALAPLVNGQEEIPVDVKQ